MARDCQCHIDALRLTIRLSAHFFSTFCCAAQSTSLSSWCRTLVQHAIQSRTDPFRRLISASALYTVSAKRSDPHDDQPHGRSPCSCCLVAQSHQRLRSMPCPAGQRTRPEGRRSSSPQAVAQPQLGATGASALPANIRAAPRQLSCRELRPDGDLRILCRPQRNGEHVRQHSC